MKSDGCMMSSQSSGHAQAVLHPLSSRVTKLTQEDVMLNSLETLEPVHRDSSMV